MVLRTDELSDATRQRALQIEVWSAQAPPGRTMPLVVFSHTSGGHRRQASYLCAHLASHGYVVAAADHAGSTAADRAARAARAESWTPEETTALVAQWVRDRVPDISSVIDHIEHNGVGLVGWSFGGWAVLAAPETDRRVGAIVALVPAGSSRPLPGIIAAPLTFAWGRDVPTLFVAAERDRFVPVDRVRELCAPGRPFGPKPAASAWAMRSFTVLRERPRLRAIWRIPLPARQCTKISTSSSTVILLRAMPFTS